MRKSKRGLNRHGQAVAPVTSDFTCRPRATALAVHCEFALAARRPPPVVAVEAAVQAIAIDCSAADGKACATCKTVKPLTDFFKTGTRSNRRASVCKACVRSAPAPTDVKACARCQVVKPLADYMRSIHCADGHAGVCKACTQVERDNRRAWEGKPVKTAPKPAPYVGVVAASSWSVQRALIPGDRADGLIKARTDLERTGIVHRGAVSPAIAGYLRATGATSCR